jgi:hypothetical protein
MDDDRATMLIRRNHALLALAAAAREDAREAIGRATDHVVLSRQSRLALARALSRLAAPTAGQPVH